MSNLVIPQGYKAPLPNYELQRAIAFIKESFQTNLSNALNLRRVSAPLFVASDSGLNDNLNGTERPVRFDIPGVGGKDAEVVHSLAKWKRLALKRYGFHVGKGLYTDMNAIRRDEDDLDNIHSVYVDQWDWEKIISREDRNEAYLKATVRAIVAAVCETSDALNVAFPSLRVKLDREVYFVTTQELEDRWPDKTPKEREPTDPLRLYLEEVAQLSSTGDEQALAAKCAAADECAMETLTNLGLHRVLEIAKDHVGCGVLLLDLIQEGSLGLW